MNHLRRLFMETIHASNERGVTTVEYAIMLVLIAIAAAAFGQGLSAAVTNVFSEMLVVLAS